MAQAAVSFLRSLDIYSPLFRLQLSEVRKAIELYDSSEYSKSIPLHKFCAVRDMIIPFFPACAKSILPIALSVTFLHTDGTHYISLLDVLLMVTATCDGTLLEKCTFFYKWFHISGYE